MSRSYKKHPMTSFVCGPTSRKLGKKWANIKVRHYKNLPDGMSYKKVFDFLDFDEGRFIIWRAMDFRHADEPPFNPRTWEWLAPRKKKCLKEIQKTRDYRKVISK